MSTSRPSRTPTPCTSNWSSTARTTAKVEHNDYTGFELQPNARVAWTPSDQTIWGAVSRAVRTPARYEHTLELDLAAVPTPGGLLGIVRLKGDPRFVSEEVIDYELGYRIQPADRLTFDLVGLYNDDDRLSSIEPAGPPVFVPDPGFPHLEIPPTFRNLTSGSAYRTELSVNFLPFDPWRLGVSYSSLKLDLIPGAESLDSGAEGPEGSTPQNQIRVQSYLDLRKEFQLDTLLY